MGTEVASGGYGASNDIFCRVVGDGAPLLLLHGLMVSGAMFVISYVPSVSALRATTLVVSCISGYGDDFCRGT